MPTALGSLRRLLLTPRLTDVTFAKRGFPAGAPDVVRRLEAIPQSVVCGFEWGIDARGLWEVERRLDLVEPELRGFAYEGATMALTVRDAMAGGRGTLTRELLRGPGRPHIFLAYIGIGFAMARLPRPLWRTVIPALDDVQYHPTMSWLAVDGYGFDRAYFDTPRWVDEQRIPAAYPWEGNPAYFLRAVDQGIGRALWFIHAADADNVATAVERFAPSRHPDLWSGVGLAATFAGGCDDADLTSLRGRSGEHRAHLAQGAVFATKARHFSGFVAPHTHGAIGALADLDVTGAVALADGTAVEPGTVDGVPAYELWREKIRAHFA
ncbi:DUF1702 family protein [Nocardiopsis ansamitocini]|uniref:Enediyne biosynthesis protein n=1 Tax=Nocardiopsis ansamitocini TaxID=1670832 RepID=A0A9W6UK53_9ACTN|nr:DUF1702 family protein [Nocardiopsis ansamitocini]GLU48725.1 hypothetical protein Nans01_30760 [Nocardiopsis ansamitocini]